jgi:hypothetical protein
LSEEDDFLLTFCGIYRPNSLMTMFPFFLITGLLQPSSHESQLKWSDQEGTSTFGDRYAPGAFFTYQLLTYSFSTRMQGRILRRERSRRLADDSPEIEHRSSHDLLECNLERYGREWDTVNKFLRIRYNGSGLPPFTS